MKVGVKLLCKAFSMRRDAAAECSLGMDFVRAYTSVQGKASWGVVGWTNQLAEQFARDARVGCFIFIARSRG